MKAQIPSWPSSQAHSEHFRLTVDGQCCTVLSGAVADFAIWQCDDDVEVRLHTRADCGGARVLPKRHGITITAQADGCSFIAPAGANLFIAIPGQPRLYLFTSPREHERPDPEAAGVHYFTAGQVYEIGCLELADGDTLYVEAGAIVRGCLRAYGSGNITVCGAGIIDGSPFSNHDQPLRHLIHWQGSCGVRMRDVTLVNPCTWTNVFYGCHDIDLFNLHQIGNHCTNDGIDLMTATQVHIRDCFIHSGDDCLAIKAHADGDRVGERETAHCHAVGGPCHDILIEGCVLMNDGAGNAIEIGHELRCSAIHNIIFRDIDILGVHGHGAALSINNMDCATVHDVLYERIRIEHHYDHLVQIRINRSRYGGDERGQVRNITFRDIQVDIDRYNEGYSHSIIGGWDAAHLVQGIRFDTMYLGELHVRSLDDFDCFIRHATDISFT